MVLGLAGLGLWKGHVDRSRHRWPRRSRPTSSHTPRNNVEDHGNNDRSPYVDPKRHRSLNRCTWKTRATREGHQNLSSGSQNTNTPPWTFRGVILQLSHTLHLFRYYQPNFINLQSQRVVAQPAEFIARSNSTPFSSSIVSTTCNHSFGRSQHTQLSPERLQLHSLQHLRQQVSLQVLPRLVLHTDLALR